MELTEYLGVLWRRGWVIVLVTALCGGVAVGLAKMQTPRYTSVVEVAIIPARLNEELSKGVANLLNSYVAMVQSESMARMVIERVGATDLDSRLLSSRTRAESIVEEFKIIIEVTDLDPQRAQQIAQVVAEVFNGELQAYAARQDPLDRLTASVLNGGAQPATRTWPRSKVMTFAGVGIGGVLGLLIALYLEWSRGEGAVTPLEVEAWLGLPVLGAIPARTKR